MSDLFYGSFQLPDGTWETALYNSRKEATETSRFHANGRAFKVEVANTIGEKLKAIRKERGLLQQTVADAVGIPRQHLSKIENRQISPSEKVLVKILAFYKMKLDVVMW